MQPEFVSLTDSAAKKIQQALKNRGVGEGIRIGVKTTGCSGLAYVLEYVDKHLDSDIKLQSQQCAIFIDPKSFPYLQGLTIDYVRKGINEGFEFINPNEAARCGCGESFTVKAQ
jgi:iron-sulfur cluster assembly protein